MKQIKAKVFLMVERQLRSLMREQALKWQGKLPSEVPRRVNLFCAMTMRDFRRVLWFGYIFTVEKNRMEAFEQIPFVWSEGRKIR